MKPKKSFVTIFTDAENFHLVKDVGQVPYFMYKTGGFDAELITYKNNSEYPYLEKEVKGLKIKFIQNLGRIFYFERAIIKYLLSSSKTIDVLNLIHFKRDNILYLLIYKALNPKGKVYVKLDINILFFKDYNAFFYSNYRLKNYLLKALTRLHLKLTDIFSVETNDAREYLLKIYPGLEKKLITIPNGVDSHYIDSIMPVRSFGEKENIIITVGRIGVFEKNNELLLESLAKADLKDWKVYILGPIEKAFQSYIDNYYISHPHLRDKILFTGNIADRKQLFEWYDRAKIFCLSSRSEGFPITFPEAMYFGNYIITTPISSAAHITAHGKYGCIAKAEPEEFARAIENSISEGFLNSGLFLQIRTFSKEHLTWPVIIENLSQNIKARCGSNY